MIYTTLTYIICITIILTPNQKANNRFALICLIFTIYSMLRYGIGIDYLSYLNIIQNQAYERFEPIQYYLAHLSNKTLPQLFFIINAIIVGFCIFGTYTNLSRKIPILLLGFCTIFFLPIGYHNSLGFIRQFTAIFLLLYASTLGSTKNRILFCILAALNHYASIVFIPLIIWQNFFKKNMSFTLQTISITIAIFIIPIIFPLIMPYLGRYSDYIKVYASNQGNKILLLYILIWFYFIYHYASIKSNAMVLYYYNLFFMGICLYIALSPFGVHLTRAASFLLLPAPIILGYILFTKNHTSQYVCLLGIIVITIILHYYAFKSPQRDFLNHYEIFIFKI